MFWSTEFPDCLKQKVLPKAFHLTLFRGNRQSEEEILRPRLYRGKKGSHWLEKLANKKRVIKLSKSKQILFVYKVRGSGI